MRVNGIRNAESHCIRVYELFSTSLSIKLGFNSRSKVKKTASQVKIRHIHSHIVQMFESLGVRTFVS